MDERMRFMIKINRNFELYKRYHVKKQSLNSTELLALHMIRHHLGITQDELSNLLGVDKGLVTKMIHKLEKEGYVLRKQDTIDKRYKHLYSTPKAEELKMDIVEVENDYFSLILSCLDSYEKETFLESLTKVYQVSKSIRKGEIK